ncbi:hypothetical protein ABU614_12665 [Lysobacter firmicutimachus]|uniref:Uncharacterized protein n=1 Tax=Lysobacter firmicutimachus TaxID=1792846 RepID=A0AAU8MLF4_9GAMM
MADQDESGERGSPLWVPGGWAGLLLLLVAGLAVFGYTAVTFVPAPWLAGPVGYGLAILSGLGLLWLFPRQSLYGRHSVQSLPLPQPLVLGLFGIALSAMSWFALTLGLPGLINEVAGHRVEEPSVMLGRVQHSRRRCDYRMVGGLAERTLRGYLCVDRDLALRHLNAPGAVRVVGRRTALGLSVVSVEAERPGRRTDSTTR